MKIPCKVVEDLLPLYHDSVCSQDSAALVEEHLAECKDCKNLFINMKKDAEPTISHIDDAAPMKSIRNKWAKDKKKIFFKGIVWALALCVFFVAGFMGLTKWKCIPVSPDILEVSEVSRLADGRIIYHLNVKDNKNLYFIKFTANEDGSYYITPMRAVIESKRTMEEGLFNDYFMVDMAENNAHQQMFGEGIVLTSCYLGPQDNGILIWKDGMELPKASKALEDLVH